MISISQAGGSCSYSVNPSNVSAGAGDSTVTLSVTAPDGCPWSINENSPFFAVVAGGSGSGNGSAQIAIMANTSPVSRSGSVTVGNVSVGIVQQGTSPSCPVTLSATTYNVVFSGETFQIAVTAAPTCSWSAVSNAGFLVLPGAPTGTGSGTITVEAGPNPRSASRSGTVTIAGETLTVMQGGTLPSLQSPPQPETECLKDFTPPDPGRGTSSDGRRILTVQIDSTWNSGGQTDHKIWNGVTDALWELNNHTDLYGNKTGYYLVMVQNGVYGDPDFTITMGTCESLVATLLGCGNYSSPSTIKFEEKISQPWITAHGVKVLAAHEISHGLGLVNVSSGSSLMIPWRMWWDTSNPSAPIRKYRPIASGVTAADIAGINHAMMSPATCTGHPSSVTGVVAEEPEEIDHPGQAERTSENEQDDTRCNELWAVTYHYYVYDGEWFFNYMTWDYLISSECAPLS
jgi:hypothetical protein